MRPDNVTIPRGMPVEIDTSDVDEAGIVLPDGVCEIEIVNGPTNGTLVVTMANFPNEFATMTRLPVGWAHSGEFKTIETGTTVTLIRYWT
jgi:hypothetical protein